MYEELILISLGRRKLGLPEPGSGLLMTTRWNPSVVGLGIGRGGAVILSLWTATFPASSTEA